MIEDQNDINLLVNDLKQPIANSSSYNGPLEPCLGLEFDEGEDTHICYNAYARKKGFSIRKNHTQLLKGDDKLLIEVYYSCSREGFCHKSYQKKIHINSEPAETRVGCKAMMGINKVGLKWTVSKFVIEHNHELLTPKSTRFLRGHRVVTRAQKNLIDTLNESGVPPKKIMSVLSKESGGDYNVGCTTKDVENCLSNRRRDLIGKGDAQRMYNYFLESQCKNPSFFFSIEVDENGCMGNCFWADTRSRAAYQYFGDVTFDATYLTNRYKMSFVPFTGVNHHHQFQIFGCALLVNETAESYT
jgi:hypothetical protein